VRARSAGSRGRLRARGLVRLLFLGYVFSLVVLLALVFVKGEQLWPITMFLFGPRWVIAVPLPILVVLALALDRRWLIPLAAASLAMLVPLLGWNVPWRRLVAGDPGRDAPALRIATWNAGGAESGPRPVLRVLEATAPDILVLQECGRGRLDEAPGWYVRRGHDTCLLSRFPLVEVAERDQSDMWKLAGSGAIVRYAFETPLGPLELTNVHLETPREGIEALLGSRLRGVPVLEAKNGQREIEARVARRWVDQGTRALRVVAGDFNTPVESDLFRRHWRGYRDCFVAAGWGFGSTKRTRRIGTRIDHVLVGAGLECDDVQVGPWVGGDHAPLVATLRRAGG